MDECELVALAKYGVAFYTLPDVLRWAIVREVMAKHQERQRFSTNRRFANWCSRLYWWAGWRRERVHEKERDEAERRAVVNMRTHLAKRKPRARRFSGRRPDLPEEGYSD
jgi:hypothetical protein